MTIEVTNDLRENSVMLHGPVFKTYLQFSVPWMLAMLFLSSAGIVDGMFIGRCEGATALAAINLISPLYSLLMGLGIMCASGGAVCVARHLGKNDLVSASAMFTKSIIAMFTLSVLVAVLILIFAGDIISAMGATGQLAEEAYTYLIAFTLFSPTLTCSMGLAYFVRVDERPRLASFGLMFTAANNIILDYLFIVVFEWGILGAAIGTGLAGTITIFILGSHFFSKEAKLRLVRDIGPWKEVLFAYWNGLSEFVSEASIGIVIFLINLIVLHELGENGVAAFTIINYTNWFVLTIAYGLADPLAPIVSINHTVGNVQRVKAFVHTALIIIMGFCIIAFITCSIAPELLLNLFLPGNMDVRPILLDFLNVYKWGFLFVGANMAITTTLTGFHLAGQSALLALTRGLILPVALLGTLPMIFGLEGLYMAIPLAEGTAFFLALFLLWRAENSDALSNKIPVTTTQYIQ